MPVKKERNLSSYHRDIWLKAVGARQLGNARYAILLMRILLKDEPSFLAGRRLSRQAAVERLGTQKKSPLKAFSSLFLIIKARSLSAKNSGRALEVLERLLEDDPYNKQANQMLYRIALAYDMPETASFALETLLESDPQDTNTMHQLAQHYAKQNEFQKAGRLYDQILKIAPSDLIAMRASKDIAARVSLQSDGWSRENATYRELLKGG